MLTCDQRWRHPIYLQDDSGTRRVALAIQWYTAAALESNIHAMYCLGAMGMKEEIAMDQGVKWLQLAAAHPDDDDGADALQMLSIWQESLLIPGIGSFHYILLPLHWGFTALLPLH